MSGNTPHGAGRARGLPRFLRGGSALMSELRGYRYRRQTPTFSLIFQFLFMWRFSTASPFSAQMLG